MQVTMELLATELGLSPQPLQEAYEAFGICITASWIKTVWEKVDRFKVRIEIAPLAMQPPWEGDKWFMQAIKEAGLATPDEWAVINRFRCHQQVLFLSDILVAGGKCVDKRYLTARRVVPFHPERQRQQEALNNGASCKLRSFGHTWCQSSS